MNHGVIELLSDSIPLGVEPHHAKQRAYLSPSEWLCAKLPTPNSLPIST